MPPLLALPLRRISHSPERPGAGPPKLQVPAAVVRVPVSFEMALPSGADGALVCVQLPFCQIHPLPEAVRAYICPPLATSRLALTPPLLALPLRRISHSPGRPGAGPPKLQVPAADVRVPVSFETALPSGADGALVCVQLPFCQIHQLPDAVRAYICPPLATSRVALTPPLLALPLRRISHSPGRPGAGPPKLQVPAAVLRLPVPFEIMLPSGDTAAGALVGVQLPFCQIHQLPAAVKA